MLYNTDWKDKIEITLSPAASLLNRCADSFERYGWCQNTVGNLHAPMCTVGALYLLAEKAKPHESDFCTPVYNEARNALIRYLRVEGGFLNNVDLVAWNNDKNRTKEQVIAAFRGAAETV